LILKKFLKNTKNYINKRKPKNEILDIDLRRKFAQSKTSLDYVRDYGPGEIISTISKNDEMYEGNQEIYFSIGKSALKCIDSALSAADKKRDDIKTILDFACGHGRVLRVLRAAFPNCDITACDVNRDGVDFCKKTFNAIPIYSERDIEKLSINSKFDLIWVGSLFTHIDREDWDKCLKFLSSLLNNQGVLVFTTAGQFVFELISLGDLVGLDEEGASKAMEDFQKFGFGYAQFPPLDYKFGRTIVKPAHVLSLLEKYDDLRVLTCTERGWAGRQDVFSCIKEPKL